MSSTDIKNLLMEKGLKITPQRVVIADLLVHEPSHPTADGRTVGELEGNGTYDRSLVKSTELIPYQEYKTYDLLPAGNTGFYWANGILLASTLR